MTVIQKRLKKEKINEILNGQAKLEKIEKVGEIKMINKIKNVNTPQECLFHNHHMTNSRKSKT